MHASSKHESDAIMRGFTNKQHVNIMDIRTIGVKYASLDKPK